MNVLLISFSGRKSPGNCEMSLEFVLQFLKGKGVDASLLRMRDMKINSCSDCNYECFEQGRTCPISDDVRFVYDQIFLSDLVIMAVPTYSAAPPARYFSWRERSQGIFTNSDHFSRYLDVVKGFVVFGNEEAGGQEALNILRQGSEESSEFLLIQSHHYDQSSIKGRLSEIPEVQEKLAHFTEDLLSRCGF